MSERLQKKKKKSNLTRGSLIPLKHLCTVVFFLNYSEKNRGRDLITGVMDHQCPTVNVPASILSKLILVFFITIFFLRNINHAADSHQHEML